MAVPPVSFTGSLERTLFRSAGQKGFISLQLPLFLHSRAAHTTFLRILRPHLASLRGLVHSFTGTLPEMQELISLGFHIGINGCSLKTAQNLEVVKAVPLDRLQLETDGPWCEIRASHAGMEVLKGVMEREGEEERWKKVKKEKWEEGGEDCGGG
ncbi:MAG: hypothetical protein Q9221_000546 [Calogaya cf. arnoldii]